MAAESRSWHGPQAAGPWPTGLLPIFLLQLLPAAGSGWGWGDGRAAVSLRCFLGLGEALAGPGQGFPSCTGRHLKAYSGLQA